jgi:hypothetical protein
MNPKSGNPGEAAVLNALVQRGFGVLLPFGEGHPFDLVLAVAGVFLRVQSKTAWRKGGCLIFNAYATDHGRGQISYVGRADLFGVFDPVGNRVYLVPVGLTDSEIRLRIAPTRNNQRQRVRWAADFELDRWSADSLLALAPSADAA